MLDMPAIYQCAQGAVERRPGDICEQRMLHECFCSDTALSFSAQGAECCEHVTLQGHGIFKSEIPLQSRNHFEKLCQCFQTHS